MISAKTFAKSDKQVQLDVIAEIERDWRFKPAEVGAEVDNGIVTLTGTVSSYLKMGEAADIAARVIGVKGVANELTVQLPGTTRVRNAIVTLKGTVDYWYQSEVRAALARRLPLEHIDVTVDRASASRARWRPAQGRRAP